MLWLAIINITVWLRFPLIPELNFNGHAIQQMIPRDTKDYGLSRPNKLNRATTLWVDCDRDPSSGVLDSFYCVWNVFVSILGGDIPHASSNTPFGIVMKPKPDSEFAFVTLSRPQWPLLIEANIDVGLTFVHPNVGTRGLLSLPNYWSEHCSY
jgi:hypothetical protein